MRLRVDDGERVVAGTVVLPEVATTNKTTGVVPYGVTFASTPVVVVGGIITSTNHTVSTLATNVGTSGFTVRYIASSTATGSSTGSGDVVVQARRATSAAVRLWTGGIGPVVLRTRLT